LINKFAELSVWLTGGLYEILCNLSKNDNFSVTKYTL